MVEHENFVRGAGSVGVIPGPGDRHHGIVDSLLLLVSAALALDILAARGIRGEALALSPRRRILASAGG